MSMEIKFLQEIGDRKDYKVSYFHDDLINELIEKVKEKTAPPNIDVDKKVFFLEFLEKEIYWANHFRLRFVKQLEDKKKSIKLKKDDKNEEKFNDYKMVKKSYLNAIKYLEKYVSFLKTKRSLIKKMRKSRIINEVQNDLNVQNITVSVEQDLQRALDTAVGKYLYPDKRTVIPGSLSKLLFFIYSNYNIVLNKKEILNLFVKPSGERYKESYCVSTLCDIHAMIKKQQNKLHKNS
jgi:hypothetical protein